MKINHKKVKQLKSFEGVELKGNETFDELLEIEKEQENKKLIESTIKNILPKNDRSKLINCNGDDFFNKEKNPAHDWPTYIKEAIKTGLESPTPYRVIPFKNGIGIKKIEFIK